MLRSWGFETGPISATAASRPSTWGKWLLETRQRSPRETLHLPFGAFIPEVEEMSRYKVIKALTSDRKEASGGDVIEGMGVGGYFGCL